MKRGEIWTASGGSDYAGKPRPVVVVQDDSFAETASITVCLLTTTAVPAELGRAAIEPSPVNGLVSTSYAMADKITTLPRAKLGRRVGWLERADVSRLNRAMIVFLGLAG